MRILRNNFLFFFLLLFILLFAFDPINGQNLDNDEHEYFWNNSNNLTHSSSSSSSGSNCSSFEFECKTSGQCILLSRFCDYIVDCEDGSDENLCGTCNFQNGTLCGWKSKLPNDWKIVDKQYLSTMPATKPKTTVILVSPNLPEFSYHCKVSISFNIKTKSKTSNSRLDMNYTITADNQFSPITLEALHGSNSWTDVMIHINDNGFESNLELKIQLSAILDQVGDEIWIKNIGFVNCNPQRSSVDCDFENGNTCNWHYDKLVSSHYWTIGKGDEMDPKSPFYINSPSGDHTTGSGHFLYTWLQNNNSLMNAMLRSEQIQFDGCLSFWYFMDGFQYDFQIDVIAQVNSTDGNRETKAIDTLTADTDGQWKFKQIQVPDFDTYYTIGINGMTFGSHAIVALDDIVMKDGNCISPVCTFEENTCSMMYYVKAGQSPWRRLSGSEALYETTMTLHDHTEDTVSGHFIIFLPKQKNDQSTFRTRSSQFENYRCLQLYYMISMDTVGTLEVVFNSDSQGWDPKKEKTYVKRSRTTLSSVESSGWSLIQLTLPPIDRSYYEVIGTAGDTQGQGFIAVDDISVYNGKCREPVNCNFESDTCGWTLERDQSSTLISRQKATSSKRQQCSGPPQDHTLQTGAGHYLSFCFDQSHQMSAAIHSVDFDASNDYCFSFWTFFQNDTDSHIDVTLIADTPKHLGTIKGDTGTWKWNKFSIDSDSTVELFQIKLLITATQFNPKESVAIDDFNLRLFKCSYHPHDNPDNNPDIVPHKPVTELIQFRCSFDLDFCNYLNISYGMQFVKSSSNFAKPTWPLADHTTHSYQGGFLLLTNPQKVGWDSTLYATIVTADTISPDSEFENATINEICVHFWYFMNGESINSLDIRTFNSTTMHTVFHIEGTFGPNWRHQAVPISFAEKFALIFAGSTSNRQGVLALDDISITVGSCPIEELCDFSFDACGWDNNVSLPIKWKLGNGQTRSTNANHSPVILRDHTTDTKYGNYLYVDATDSSSRGDTAQMISPMIKPDKKCIQFWYYLFGDNIGSLNVYIVYNGLINLKYLLRTVINSDANEWMLTQVPIEKHFFDMDFQFVIEMKRSDDLDQTYRVAIDDVEIHDFCQPIVSCNFEDDFCGYSNVENPSYNYSLWSRAVRKISLLSPDSDHTIGQDGIYAYLQNGEYGALKSPVFNIDSANCLSFYYFVNGEHSLPTLNVTMINIDLDLQTVQYYDLASLGSSNNAPKNQWNKFSQTISFDSERMKVMFLGYLDNSPNQFIGLDDVSFVPGNCDAVDKGNKFSCNKVPANYTIFINQTQVCDFFSDCPNGSDEVKCGYSCHFTINNCYWVLRNVTSTFVRVDLQRPNHLFRQVMPTLDHSFMSSYNGGYLRLYDTPGVFGDSPEAIVESPDIHNSAPYCTLSFYYYLHDPVDKKAELSVRLIEPNNPLGIQIFLAEGDFGTSWNFHEVLIGRVPGKFKIQIRAKLLIEKGGGAIAIDDIAFDKNRCLIGVKANPDDYSCKKKRNINHCSNSKFCFDDDMLCDFKDDCSDESDESPKLCDYRHPLRCDFEDGICNWFIKSQFNKTALNGFLWGSVDDIEDYVFALKRDHTLNNEFGHLVYLWNQQKLIGQIQSQFIFSSGSGCALRLYYVYQTRLYQNLLINFDQNIGTLNVYVKFSKDGKLFLVKSISHINSLHFERLNVKFDSIKQPFFIVIEIVPGTDLSGMWAIDDTSFSSDCALADSHHIPDNSTYTPFPIRTTAHPTGCTSDQFLCDKIFCMNKTKMCDFNPDCDDGTDESNCGINSFDNGWRDFSEGYLKWEVDSGNNVAGVKVLGDGTGDRAVFRSVQFGGSYADCIITFNYFLGIPSSQSLGLSLTSPNGSLDSTIFQSEKSDMGNSWNSAKVFVGEQPHDWYLDYIGRREPFNAKNDSIMIRNMKFVNCANRDYNDKKCKNKLQMTCDNGVCVNKNLICDFNDDCGDNSDEQNCQTLSGYRCSFGATNNQYCHINMTSDHRWKLYRGEDTENFVGPGLDHTTDTEKGYFIMATSADFNNPKQMAQFEMPTLLPDNSANCSVRFWYMIHGGGVLSVYRRNQGSTELKLITSIDSTADSKDQSFIWQRFSEPLISKFNYDIVVTAKVNKLNQTFFVAIDDISFTKQCKMKPVINPNVTTTTMNPKNNCINHDQFQCHDGSCVNMDQVCDFYRNCAGGEDENSCPSDCHFQNNTCFWEIDHDLNPAKILWSRETPRTALKKTAYFPPKFSKGPNQYLLIYPDNFTKLVDPKLDFNVFSPQYSSAAPSCVMIMDYYVATGKSGSTSVYTVSVNDIGHLSSTSLELYRIDSSDRTYLNKWNTISIGIGRRSSFTIGLRRLHNSHMAESFAIGSVQFVNCSYRRPHKTKFCGRAQFTCHKYYSCIDNDLVCDLKEDCPDGSDEANCPNSLVSIRFENSTNLNGFSIMTNDTGVKIVSGADPKRPVFHSGPPFDHSYFNLTGHYLLSLSKNSKSNSISQQRNLLISPMFKSESVDCLIKFYYYMFDPNATELTINVRTEDNTKLTPIESFSNHTTDRWIEAVIPLSNPKQSSDFQVIFSANVAGDIAIDDIVFSESCQISDHKPVTTTTGTSIRTSTSTSKSVPTTLTPTTKRTVSTVSTSTSKPSNCPQGSYRCSPDNTCLPVITKCNFALDCSDGSDEVSSECTQAKCSFNSAQYGSICGLAVVNTAYLSSAPIYSWTFSTKNNLPADKFKNVPKLFDSFVYVNSGTGSDEDFTEIVTDTFTETDINCLLYFRYICNLDDCPLFITVLSNLTSGTERNIIWQHLDNEITGTGLGYAVYEANIYVGRRSNFKLSFGSRKLRSSNSYVLIDEYSFQDCAPPRYIKPHSSFDCNSKQFKCSQSCISNQLICDYQSDCRMGEDESNCMKYVGRCDFENVVLCNFWTFEQNDMRLAFESESGLTGISYLPRIDHTFHSEKNYYLSFYLNSLPNYSNLTQYYARYVSNTIYGNNTVDCRLRLWYNLIGNNCQLRIVKRVQEGQLVRVVKLATLKADLYDYWKRVDFVLITDITDKHNFEVVLDAMIPQNQTCSVNIDDISLTPECFAMNTTTIPVTPTNDPFNLCAPNLMCKNKRCYNFDQLCNFFDDCLDGTDEQTCPASVTFENVVGFGGWFVPNGFRAKFSSIRGPSPMRMKGGYGPLHDNTLQTAYGHYIVATNFSQINSKVELHSAYFGLSGPNCRFNFAYFLDEPTGFIQLNLYLKLDLLNPNITKIWSFTSANANLTEWNHESVYIGRQIKRFGVMFEAIHTDKRSKSDLAFDDFHFSRCGVPDEEAACNENEFQCDDKRQCIAYWRFCDGELDCNDGSDEAKCRQANGTCWFADTNWKTHCNWDNLQRDFKWTFVANNCTSIDAPMFDQLYGHIVMNSTGRVFGERAAIESQPFPASTDLCSIGFYYRMHGADSMGELNVIVNGWVYTIESDGKKVNYFHISGNQGPEWNYYGHLMVGNGKPFRVVFEGVVGTNQYSDIALGYISFSKDCAAGHWIHQNGLKDDTNCDGYICVHSNECISLDWVCDGEVDCKDGSDEVNCDIIHPTHSKHSFWFQKPFIATISAIMIVALVIASIVVYQIRNRRRSQQDRVPFLDNRSSQHTRFETTSHRDLDYRTANRVVNLEMTSRKIK